MHARRIAPVLLALVALAAAPLPPLASAAGERDPLLASGGGPEGGWVSVAYEIPPGGEAYLGIRAKDYAGPLHVMMVEYRANGSILQGYEQWRWGGEDREPFVHVQPHGAPGATLRVEAGTGASIGSYFGMGFGQRNVFQTPLTRILLLSAAQQGGEHAWVLHGTTGVRILALEQGDDARLYRTADFVQGEGLALVAPTAPGVIDVNAFQDVGGRIDIDIERRFFGFFGAGDGTHACTGTLVADDACHDPEPEGTLAWRGPAGADEGPAATLDVKFRDAPPGAYAFEVRDWSSLQLTQGGPCVGPLWTCASLTGAEVVLAAIDAEPAIP